MRTLIQGATIITMDPAGSEPIRDGQVGIEDSTIGFVSGSGELPPGWRPDRVIDATGGLLLPGLVNSHTHAAMTLVRGYGDDLDLHHWLNEKIFPVEDRLTGEDVYWATLLASAEMIRAGITCFADMYFFMEDTARAVEESGMRASLSRGLSAGNAERGLRENRELIARWNGAADGRITVMLGPHAIYTCPPALMAQVLDLAGEEGAGIHIHIAETRKEFEDCLARHGVTPVQLLKRLGLFEHHVLAAHCVHVTPEDIEILSKLRGGVAHNPMSNLKLASGVAPLAAMEEKGVPLALGTDGASSSNTLDLFEAMRHASYSQKAATMNSSAFPAPRVLEMATTGGAKALGLEDRIGRVAPGMKADLVILALDRPNLCPVHDPYPAVAYAARPENVDTVIIGGRVVMEHRQLKTIDEERVIHEVSRRAGSLVAPAGETWPSSRCIR